MPFSSIISALSAIAVGMALGFIFQRGRFCLNSAFRDIIFVQDLTLFRAYLLCLAVAVLGTNILNSAGLIMTIDPDTGNMVSTNLLRQNVVPLANILGGFLFGMGIVLAGGCASGIVYRFGEGQIAAMVAILGFFLGIVTTTDGVLSPVRDLLKSWRFEINGKSNLAIWDLFGGGPTAKWLTIGIFVIVLLVIVFKGKPTFGKSGKGYSWGLTGLLVGILTIVGWEVSSFFGGAPRGLAIATPLREFFNTVISKSSHSPFPEFSFLGYFTGTWGVFFILGVPVGGWLSAVLLKEFKWKVPSPSEILTVFFGSIIMGIGAVIAGGCNVGHGITGMSTMSLASLISITAILLGNWTMVYFKFIKPMKD